MRTLLLLGTECHLGPRPASSGHSQNNKRMVITMKDEKFAGDKKKGEWFLAKAEKRMVNWMVPHVPPFLETYHLTLLTLLWSAGIVAFSFLARDNINWLWGVSFFIFLQYISDVLDGAVGRYRETGLVKWGFYMDHLLDYVFLASVIVGYALIFTNIPWYWFMALMALGGAFMVNMFLSFAATNEFRISVLKIGPTEARIFFVLVNTAIILLGTGWVEVTLPFFAAGLTVALVFLVCRTQRYIWKIDMAQKKGRVGLPEEDRSSRRASSSVALWRAFRLRLLNSHRHIPSA